MKKKSLLTTLLLIIGLGSYTVLNTSYSGGFGSYQGNCNCHGGSNSATTVAVNGLPTFYDPGQTYPITVTVSNAGLAWAGFQIQANIGTLTTTDPDVTIQSGNTSAGHNKRKAISGGTATFSLNWVAPIPGGAAASVNAVGNAVNGSGTGGDAWNAAPSTNIALPAKFASVTAVQNQKQIDVRFETLNEINVKQFDIERSTNSTDFDVVATLNPNATRVYEFSDIDTRLNVTYYYRVKEISNDNNAFYSEVTSIKFLSDKNVTIYPTTVNNGTIKIAGLDNNERNTIVFSDLIGRQVLQQNITMGSVNFSSLPAGMYFVTVLENGSILKTQKVIVR